MISLTIVNLDTSDKEAIVVFVKNSSDGAVEEISFSSGATVKEITQSLQARCDKLNAANDLSSLVGMEFTTLKDSVALEKGVLNAN